MKNQILNDYEDVSINYVEIGALSYCAPVLFNVIESIRENHKWVEFSLSNCYNISSGQVIKFNGMDCKIISLVFDMSIVTVSVISIKPLNEICLEIWDSLDNISNYANTSCKEPISDYDKDIDNILEQIFATDYAKEIRDLQILKQNI